MATAEGAGQSTGDSVRQIIDQVSFYIKKYCMVYAYKV